MTVKTQIRDIWYGLNKGRTTLSFYSLYPTQTQGKLKAGESMTEMKVR